MSDKNSLNIRRLMPTDSYLFAEGVNLLNRTQGTPLFVSTYLQERTEDPRSFVVAIFNKQDAQDEKMVGVAVAQILNDMSYYEKFDPHISIELKHKIVGSFSTMSVDEFMQGKGIGQMLSQKRLEWLKLCGCDVIVGVSWVSGLQHTSNRVFEKTGFSAVSKVDDFYAYWSIQKNFVCPACGGPPCRCPAILYRMDLNKNQ